MKRKGPTQERAKRIIAMLEKAGRKGKGALWLDIASVLSGPRRHRPSVNLWKLDKLARVFPGKVLLVPGKVLGKGGFSEKAQVVAFEFSDSAREKNSKSGGKAVLIEDALPGSPKNTVIVK
jgi:ribosomal protein L18E